VKFSSVVSIQIFSLKNANPSINEKHVENDYFLLPSKFEMKAFSRDYIILEFHLRLMEYTLLQLGIRSGITQLL
jgi:hypothetical protein